MSATKESNQSKKGQSRTKWRIFFLMAAIVFACLAYSYLKQDDDYFKSGLPIDKTVVMKQSGGHHTFKLEIASRPIDVEIGLMHRKYMPKDHGMLFQLGKDPRVISFWMKNTLIPLDMLFVGPDGTIVNIHHNATPKSLTSVPSQLPVTAVIELNGGRADETGIKIGDRVLHAYFGTADE